MRTPALLIASTVFVGCGGSAPVGEAVETWELSRDLRIGSIDDPDQSLTYFAEVQIGPDEEIYIPQPRERRIRVYSADGSLLRTIGRFGQGPGEFQTITRLGWRGDTLWVADRQLRRISLFSPDGEVYSTLRVDLPAFRGTNPVEPGGLLSDGSVVAVPRIFSEDVVSGKILEYPLLRASQDGTVLDTIVWLSLEHSKAGVQNRDAPWRGLYRSPPFPDNPLWQFLPDGSALIVVDRLAPESPDDAEIGVHKLSVAGDTLWSRRYAFAPELVARSVKDSAIDEWVERVLDARGPGISNPIVAERRVREALFLPDYHPGVLGSRFAVGPDGSMWLPVRQATEPKQAYWLISPEGELVAQMPRTFEIFLGTEEVVWGRETDELDVSYLVRARAVQS